MIPEALESRQDQPSCTISRIHAASQSDVRVRPRDTSRRRGKVVKRISRESQEAANPDCTFRLHWLVCCGKTMLQMCVDSFRPNQSLKHAQANVVPGDGIPHGRFIFVALSDVFKSSASHCSQQARSSIDKSTEMVSFAALSL